jgi:AP-2 complex subunit mu-1
MIGVLLFLNHKGDIILTRAFRDGFNTRQLADTFRDEVVAPKKTERCPVNVFNRITFCHLRYETIYVVSCANANINCMAVFQYMIRLLQVIKTYFPYIDEDRLKENFVTIQELIDETNDFGYPQMTEAGVLRSYITESGSRADVLNKQKESEQITIKATGKIPWRKEGIAYMKNEVFMDVIEDVNVLLSQTGQVLQREVNGRVIMKGFLSGMPECVLTLNDKMLISKVKEEKSKKDQIEFDDVTFHGCVGLSKFDADRNICFVPPDGDFVLMRYRTSGTVAPPLIIVGSRVKEAGRSRMEIDFRLKAEFPSKLHAVDILVKIPVPSTTATVNARVPTGKAKYDPSAQAILWKIRKMQGGTELSFSAEVSMIAATNQPQGQSWSRPPVSLAFKLTQYAASGLEVIQLMITERKLGYKAETFVRYVTTGGQYQCRI